MADLLFSSLLDTISTARNRLAFLRDGAVEVHQCTANSVGSLARCV